MVKKCSIYACDNRDTVVEALTADSTGVLSCCGKEMKALQEQSADKALEKHVPVIEKIAGGYKVTVGSTPHPMEEKHWITWIELSTEGGYVLKKHMNPGEPPEAVFHTDRKALTAREYCNVHGLWKNSGD